MALLAKVFLAFFGLFGSAHAEYRMFTLKITNTQTQAFRLVDSTLDPFQYPAYFAVGKEEIVEYTDTWRCFGRTGGGQPPCPNPRKQESTVTDKGPATDEGPASNPKP